MIEGQTKRLAIIPARGGSKRIPRKNIKSFVGRPIISYPIAAAIKANCFDEIMVSSDDPEILAVARGLGANTPFVRSRDASSDEATTADVIKEVLSEYEKVGRRFDEVCCLYPTAAFVTPSLLADSLNRMITSHAEACIPILPYTYNIQRALGIKKGHLAYLFPEHELTRSQDLEPSYHDAGQFYWLKTEAFKRDVKIFLPKTVGYPLPSIAAHDIDTLEDWDIAEFKYAYARERGLLPDG